MLTVRFARQIMAACLFSNFLLLIIFWFCNTFELVVSLFEGAFEKFSCSCPYHCYLLLCCILWKQTKIPLIFWLVYL